MFFLIKQSPRSIDLCLLKWKTKYYHSYFFASFFLAYLKFCILQKSSCGFLTPTEHGALPFLLVCQIRRYCAGPIDDECLHSIWPGPVFDCFEICKEESLIICDFFFDKLPSFDNNEWCLKTKSCSSNVDLGNVTFGLNWNQRDCWTSTNAIITKLIGNKLW